jgi:hypothetical protein
MKHAPFVLVLASGLLLAGLLAIIPSASAHEQEVSVDWLVAYANIQVLAPPVFTLYPGSSTLPLSGAGTVYTFPYPVIGDTTGGRPLLHTGDYVVASWSFRYVGSVTVRGDLFWVTRLGLDFGTVGRYIDTGGTGLQWIGASSFELRPNTRYDAALVLRSIQPTLRHLHVGISVQNVGNIPTAPTDTRDPPMPTLYGIFTDAIGPVTEPLQGFPITPNPFGAGATFNLLTPWPWAVASLFGQIVIGFFFIGIMWWYGRYESRKGAKT